MALHCVVHGDAAHCPATPVVKGAESAEEFLGQAPALATVEKDGETADLVDGALVCGCDVLPREEAGTQRTESCCGGGNALVDVRL